MLKASDLFYVLSSTRADNQWLTNIWVKPLTGMIKNKANKPMKVKGKKSNAGKGKLLNHYQYAQRDKRWTFLAVFQ